MTWAIDINMNVYDHKRALEEQQERFDEFLGALQSNLNSLIKFGEALDALLLFEENQDKLANLVNEFEETMTHLKRHMR